MVHDRLNPTSSRMVSQRTSGIVSIFSAPVIRAILLAGSGVRTLTMGVETRLAARNCCRNVSELRPWMKSPEWNDRILSGSRPEQQVGRTKDKVLSKQIGGAD